MSEEEKGFKVLDFFRGIIESRNRGIPRGITSICSYNSFVIESVMELSKRSSCLLLIESTCNQVNQYGGYTGLTPHAFLNQIIEIASKVNFPKDRIIYGGDHLGPFPFREEPADIAMEKAEEMVRAYVTAGAKKLHLDTSMPLGEENTKNKLPTEIIAERCARLCQVAEKTFTKINQPRNPDLLYVIGTDVPPPGGSDEVEEGLKPTSIEDFKETVETTRYYFKKFGLEGAWERVIAVVIQPGVEYGDHTVIEYNRKNTEQLKKALNDYPDLIFEGHSTDYQTEKSLKEMVEDGIAILKVGPHLTFTLRETLFMLDLIETEIFRKMGCDEEATNLIKKIETHMLSNPQHWKSQHDGTENEIRFKIKYSFFDRVRYYLTNQEIKDAINRLLENLERFTIPLSLYSQYLPIQYKKIREGTLKADPYEIIRDRIGDVLKTYFRATGYRTC